MKHSLKHTKHKVYWKWIIFLFQHAAQTVIDYMMSYVANASTSTTICTYVIGVLETMILQYHGSTGKYTDQFNALQETVIQKTEREAPPNLLMIGGMTFIEGKQ